MVDVNKVKEEYYEDLSGEYKSASPSSYSSSASSSASASLGRRVTGPTRHSKRGWTKEEDYLLTEAVKICNAKNWKKIAEFVPGRTDAQCLHRWQKVLNPFIYKGPWTKEEDDRITMLVQKYGCRRWSVIAKFLGGRIGKQCRERWFNHLDPTIRKDSWTDEEEAILTYYHQIYGNKWTKLAKLLPGRPANAIKNHWHCILKKEVHNDGCSDSSDQEITLECMKEEKQVVDETICLNQSSAVDYHAGTWNLDFVRGIANQSEIKVEADSGEFRKYAYPGLPNEQISPFSRVHYDSHFESTIDDSITRPFRSNAKDPNMHELGSPSCSRVASQDLLPSTPFAASPSSAMFPIGDNQDMLHINSSFGYSTPPRLKGSCSSGSGSPESILRIRAMTFKNTPSIVRRRSYTKACDGTSADAAFSPVSAFKCFHLEGEDVNVTY